QTTDVRLAVGAAKASAAALGLRVGEAVVLHDANRLALRLLPCDVLVRVGPAAHRAGTAFEVEVARRLAESGNPVAALDPRVEPRAYVRDGFVSTFWTYYEPVSPGAVAPAAYARALQRLHAGLRAVDLPAPHVTDRITEAQLLVGSHARTPALADAARELLSTTLRDL